MNRILDLVIGRRTVRRFKPDALPKGLLGHLVDAGRLGLAGCQVRRDVDFSAELFVCLKWAAYINPAGNPAPGQEPAAYIIVLVNTAVREKMFEYDVGAAMENMIIAALGEGIGACWLLSIDRDRIREILKVPESFRIDSVLALGYPDEAPESEDFKESVKYWKDENGTLHVPKRKLGDVLHVNGF